MNPTSEWRTPVQPRIIPGAPPAGLFVPLRSGDADAKLRAKRQLDREVKA